MTRFNCCSSLLGLLLGALAVGTVAAADNTGTKAATVDH